MPYARLRHPLAYVARSAMLFPALAVAVVAMVPASKPPLPWRTNLASAIAEAKTAGKDVLVEFTTRGGDVDAPALDRLVFDQERFLRGVGRRFVPVRLAVVSASPDVAVVSLAERLAVARVPSLVLMDSEGRPYAAVENDSQSVDVQLELVERASARRALRDAAMSRAAASSGVERASHLHAALQHVGRFALEGYEQTAQEIVDLDMTNSAGLKEVYAAPIAEKRINRLIQSSVYPLIDRADFRGAVVAIDSIITRENPQTAHLQKLTAFKGQLLLSMGRENDARRLLREALDLSPDSSAADKVRTAIEQLDENVDMPPRNSPRL